LNPAAGVAACDPLAGAFAGGAACVFAGGAAGDFAGACCARTAQAHSPSANTAIAIRFIRPPQLNDERWLGVALIFNHRR
jgi:hypothetical protein